jgi:hypothetical protein
MTGLELEFGLYSAGQLTKKIGVFLLWAAYNFDFRLNFPRARLTICSGKLFYPSILTISLSSSTHINLAGLSLYNKLVRLSLYPSLFSTEISYKKDVNKVCKSRLNSLRVYITPPTFMYVHCTGPALKMVVFILGWFHTYALYIYWDHRDIMSYSGNSPILILFSNIMTDFDRTKIV